MHQTCFSRGIRWVLSLMVLFGSATAVAVPLELPPIGMVSRSELYQISVSGRHMVAQQCDGRAGPASYLHLLISEAVTFTVTCPLAQGKWEIFGDGPVDVQTTNDTLMFTLEKPAKLLIRTAADERLFIFADARDENAPEPGAPGCLFITDLGITGQGDGMLTDDIQTAIDGLAAQPEGGTLVFPPGLYRTGTLRIKSGVTVHLLAGARLQGSEDPADYPVDEGTTEQPDRTQDIRSRLILFDGVENAAIIGQGEIDGAGQVIRGQHKRVPNLIRVRRSKNIRIEGLLLRRAAGWNTHIFHSDNVVVRDLKSFCNWSDGLDVDNSRNVSIQDVLIDSYDDSFVIKATGFDEHAKTVRDISLRDATLCTVKSAVKIGTETLADVMENIAVKNVTIAGARGGLAIMLRDGAVVRNVAYDTVRIHNVEAALQWNISKRQGLGRIENISLVNIQVPDAVGSELQGYDAEHQIRNVRIVNYRRGDQIAGTLEDAGIKVNEFVSNLTVVAPTASASQPAKP